MRCGSALFIFVYAYLAPLYFGRVADLSAVAVDAGGFFEGLAAGFGATLLCAGDLGATLGLAGDLGA